VADRDDRIQYLRDAIDGLGYRIDGLTEDILYAQREIEEWEALVGLHIEEQHTLNTELQDLLKEEDNEE
jgi:hypothetical protein